MAATIFLEYIPKNTFEQEATFKDMRVFVSRVSPILIPMKNALSPLTSNVTVKIYPNLTNIRIDSVTLSSNSTNSTLSYNSGFTNISGNTLPEIYRLQVYSQHTGVISNFTSPYTINILYSDNFGKINSHALSFNWSAKTLDLSTVTYFWIVMIGVLASRLLSLAIAPTTTPDADPVKEEGKTKAKNKQQYLWILFSFIIVLLIFSSFRAQVRLTSIIILNITLAFAFGFGFDKVLEVAQKFKDL
jgi:hypothetical protein